MRPPAALSVAALPFTLYDPTRPPAAVGASPPNPNPSPNPSPSPSPNPSPSPEPNPSPNPIPNPKGASPRYAAAHASSEIVLLGSNLAPTGGSLPTRTSTQP